MAERAGTVRVQSLVWEVWRPNGFAAWTLDCAAWRQALVAVTALCSWVRNVTIIPRHLFQMA